MSRVSKVVLFSRKKRPNSKKPQQEPVQQEAAQQTETRQTRLRQADTPPLKTQQATATTEASKKKKKKKKKSLKRRLITLGVVLAIFAGLYLTAVYSDIPFVKKWREIYIFTAMDTYTHKWLAEAFIPKGVIDEVMAQKDAFQEYQENLPGSSWEPTPSTEPSASASADPNPGPTSAEQARIDFLNRFYELNVSTFDEYVANNPSVLDNGYDKLLINEAGLSDKGTTIYTKAGDQVLVLDAENGIIIVKVTGSGFVGKLAIVRDPRLVRVGTSKYLGSIGQTIGTIAQNNGAILAINASGFADPEWNGNGGSVVGLLISNGKTYNKAIKNGYLTIGFGEEDDRLYIGSSVKVTLRDAVEFMPAIILNGKDVTGSATGFYGIQPRSVIGQAADGTVFLLTIDGRQVGYSLGATVVDAAKILLNYNAVQAANLDGGSSTIMIYRDEIITKTSGLQDYGRLCPDAFIVDYASSIEQEMDGPG